MSGAGTAKRGFFGIASREEGPLYDWDLMSGFRQSHPVDADILFNSIQARRDKVQIGGLVGLGISSQIPRTLCDRFLRRLPAGHSCAQLFAHLVGTWATYVVCMCGGTALGICVGENWGKGKKDPLVAEAEAKYFYWLRNRYTYY